MGESTAVDRLTMLNEATSEIEACESEDELYDLILEAADQIISFDAGIVCTDQDGVFLPQSVMAPTITSGDVLDVNEGVMGKTFQTGETQLIDELTTVPEANPTSESFVSALSVPLDQYGVAQFHATEPSAFSKQDRQLIEILADAAVMTLTSLKSQTALSVERNQFAALFQNISDAALEYRLSGESQIIESVNSAFVKTFGHSGDTVVGACISDVLLPDETEMGPEHPLAKESATKTPVEVQRETRSGTQPFLLQNVPIESTAGELRGYLIYTDLTELKQRERELDRLRQIFSRVFRHNVRNELTVMQGNVQIIDRETDDEAVNAALSTVDDSTQRLLSHTKKAQDIDEVIQTGDDQTTQALTTVVSQAINECLQEYPEADISADVDDVQIRAHPLVGRAFTNAIENAITHNEDPTVVVRNEAENHTVKVWVEDTGTGIPESELEVLETGAETSLSHSSGVGLWLIQWITEKSNGNLEVTNTNQGARIEMTFQRAQSALPAGDNER